LTTSEKEDDMNMKKITASILAFTLMVSLPSGVFPSQTAKAALTHTLGNPVITDGVSIWDCVWFGNYYINSKKKDPIKWRVLSVKGQDAFLMSDQILDHRLYNKNSYSHNDSSSPSALNKSWADSDIRSWLNKTFMKAAFTAEEQKAITTTKVKTSGSPISGIDGNRDTSDKIYLPSFEEVSNTAYGFPVDYTMKSEARKAANTTYLAQKLLDLELNIGNKRELKDFLGYDAWWLRNPARESCKMYINVKGKHGADGRGRHSHDAAGVRPVLHLNLSKAETLTYAGRINSKGEVTQPSAIQTEQPLPSQPVRKENKRKMVKLANVKITSLKNKRPKSIKVKWKKITGAKGYQLQYSTSSKFKGKKTKNTKSVSYLCKKLKKNKKYYFRIRACLISDKKKIYGCWSKTKKITVKK